MDSCLDERRKRSTSRVTLAIDDRRELKLRDANITSVVWAAGYRFSYEWLDLPILDSKGAPVQERGVTACPGVYFLGLHWMRERMRASP
jgi:putative flavoprotein involved in K+ transport